MAVMFMYEYTLYATLRPNQIAKPDICIYILKNIYKGT